MIRGKWLVGYAEIDGVDRVLRQMSQRFPRENPMAEGAEALREAHAKLAAIFEDLWPEMITEFGLHRSKFIGKV
jgi:acyl carrier protein phosphodiesterase